MLPKNYSVSEQDLVRALLGPNRAPYLSSPEDERWNTPPGVSARNDRMAQDIMEMPQFLPQPEGTDYIMDYIQGTDAATTGPMPAGVGPNMPGSTPLTAPGAFDPDIAAKEKILRTILGGR